MAEMTRRFSVRDADFSLMWITKAAFHGIAAQQHTSPNRTYGESEANSTVGRETVRWRYQFREVTTISQRLLGLRPTNAISRMGQVN
jgi:hypothetical protein